mmetsp:Transcript_7827/g.15735  ORF Transcript_7827/g.15735 Transcript_7827/m.15735 type:complete len:92 (+) Transcript_7827:876-1151(+)
MEMLHRDVGNHARATRTAASVRVALTLVVDAALRCMMAQSIHIAELRFVVSSDLYLIFFIMTIIYEETFAAKKMSLTRFQFSHMFPITQLQ